MSSLTYLIQCGECSCREFVPNPFLADGAGRCVNCFHEHAPPSSSVSQSSSPSVRRTGPKASSSFSGPSSAMRFFDAGGGNGNSKQNSGLSGLRIRPKQHSGPARMQPKLPANSPPNSSQPPARGTGGNVNESLSRKNTVGSLASRFESADGDGAGLRASQSAGSLSTVNRSFIAGPEGIIAGSPSAGRGAHRGTGGGAPAAKQASTPRARLGGLGTRLQTKKVFSSWNSPSSKAKDDVSVTRQASTGNLSPPITELEEKRKSRDDSSLPSALRSPYKTASGPAQRPKFVTDLKACSECDADMPSFARFCTSCGAAATEARPGPRESAVERQRLKPLPKPPGSEPETPSGEVSVDEAPVPQVVLADIPPPTVPVEELTHRERVVRELIGTERTYVEGLLTLRDIYYAGMREFPSVTRAKVDMVISNASVDAMISVNQKLLEDLCNRLKNGFDDASTKIGDIFPTMGPYLKPMYSEYGDRYQTSQRALLECEKDGALDAFLVRMRDENPVTKGQSIRALLITPVQRMPRYNMLLEDLLKSTPDSHPDFENLQAAVGTMKGISSAINEAIRRGENLQKIVMISQRFVAAGVGQRTRSDRKIQDLVAPHRQLIRDGPMMKLCRKNAKQRWFFVFNDILMYATPVSAGGEDKLPRLTLAMQFDINSLHIEDVPDVEPQGPGEPALAHAFEIRTPKKSFVVMAESLNDKFEWMLAITGAIEESKAKRATFRIRETDADDPTSVRHASVEENKAPVWIPDSLAPNCNLCRAKFTQIKRRHHCRKCGSCICGSCSSHKIVVDSSAKKKRACDTCWTEANP